MQQKPTTNFPLFLRKVIDEYVCLLGNEKGELFEMFTLPKPPNKNNDCHEICPHELARPHFTCWRTCRRARAYRGELPTLIRVRPYTLLIHTDRPNFRLKDMFIKKLATIQELLAN
jgi:hypothetical protein